MWTLSFLYVKMEIEILISNEKKILFKDKIYKGLRRHRMDELYMEQNVKRKISFRIRMLKIGLYTLAVLGCVLIVFRMDMFWVSIALAFLAYTVSMVFDVQYEYIHGKELLVINKIDGWNKKRKLATVDLTHVELIVPQGDYRLDAYKTAEEFDFSARDASERPYIMVVNSKNGMKKLILQFDEDMVESFKNRMPRKVFSD